MTPVWLCISKVSMNIPSKHRQSERHHDHSVYTPLYLYWYIARGVGAREQGRGRVGVGAMQYVLTT